MRRCLHTRDPAKYLLGAAAPISLAGNSVVGLPAALNSTSNCLPWSRFSLASPPGWLQRPAKGPTLAHPGTHTSPAPRRPGPSGCRPAARSCCLKQQVAESTQGQGGNGVGVPSDAPGGGGGWLGNGGLLKNRSSNQRRGQIRTVMSKLPETTDPPSGRKQTERTVRRCPFRLVTTCMEAASITFTSLS